MARLRENWVPLVVVAISIAIGVGVGKIVADADANFGGRSSLVEFLVTVTVVCVGAAIAVTIYRRR